MENTKDRIELDYSHITLEGVNAFLASTAVAGIGKVLAKRLTEKYGVRVIDKILMDPLTVTDVKGVGESRLLELANLLKDMDTNLETCLIMYSAGVKELFVDRILAKYRKNAQNIILNDPYSMVEDVWRLSFYTADKIGRLLHFAADDPRRLRGALLTTVKHFAEDGHLFVTKEQALDYASKITGVSTDQIRTQIDFLVENGRLIKDHGVLYLPVFHKAESEATEKIMSLMTYPATVVQYHYDELPEYDIAGNRYSDTQKEAVKMALNNKVSIITGGPGSGKTTVLKGILEILSRQNKQVVLVAPTGRAAKRMSTLTGYPASTIHRLLGYKQGEGYRKKKIAADVLIIDEGSMLEQVMLNHLLDVISPETKLIIVGDVDQLPSIGAGDVLREMIASGKIPTVVLTENFRQSQGCLIAESARKINRGEMPEFDEMRNFMFCKASGIKEIKEKIIELVASELPTKYNLSPKDIIVVTPKQVGELGVRQFNDALQERLNPTGPQIKRGDMIMRLGDPVMQTTNSAERGIYNGETGVITEIDEINKTMIVTFSDKRTSEYKGKEIGELTLSYATSVHKLQGSEVNNMIMPVTMEHRPMLYRNLIYTAISRARDLCVLVGSTEALEYAIANDIAGTRNSHFKTRLTSKD